MNRITMKKGLRSYAIRSDTNVERRHISDMASRIFCVFLAHESCQDVAREILVEWSVRYAYKIAEAVDAQITQEIEEINADLERERVEIEQRIKERQKGANDGDQKENPEDISSKFGPDRLPGYLDK